ncbi:MAG: type II toxin-antitoxin system VapC family toxin [Blastocatellia bacterium]
MSSVIADTHVVIWFLEQPSRLSTTAERELKNAIESSNENIFLSAISLIEIQYLIEKGRISSSFLATLFSELDNPDPIFVIVPVDQDIARNCAVISRADVPDMPDRIIAVTASHLNLPLISADRSLQSSRISVIW